MADELLDAIEIETAPDPDAAVIWMHGLGDDGRGWSEVVPSLGLPKHLAIRFVFPHAPIMPVTINNGMRMRAWYDIRQANLSERADIDGVRRSQAQVGALLAREASRGIAANRTLLAGFSQGGAIALFAGLRFDARLAGVIALSAYLIAPERLAAEASAANRDVPVFMAHGTHDPVIAFAWAEHSRD
ncbi:MAG TPA: carboxylesterase, partial [Casimicrobiaceae bacterium]|nr:carboxylesterase [Casimicrobiaceae bacterium]